MKRSIRSSLLRILAGVVSGLMVVVYPIFYFNQDQMIFRGASANEEKLQWARTLPGVRELRLPMADGVELHGWLLPVEGDPSAPLVIYFGGNSQDVTGMLKARDDLPGIALLTLNYRGYGLSGGKPSQDLLFADAAAIYDWAERESGLTPRHRYVWGRSLGSGVAVRLASQRAVDGVILTTPFDSLRAVAQKLYPWIPIGLLLRHPFDSLALAPSIKTPMLALAGTEDQLVPATLAENLVAHWGGPRRIGIFPGAGHNDIESAEGYWEAVRSFLN